MKSNSPEILAPVASFDMCRAAVHNGADAIYIGMPHFNARGRSHDFSFEELKNIIDYSRLHGVKTFVAFNILIFQNELKQVVELLKEVIKFSPDAFIVQDLGLVRLIKGLYPEQIVHASTQMTITNVEAIEITSDLGISRYVLGREVSMEEMQKIREKTEAELEVFVHGALCVSYSGQCLTSERVGGRSANRGQCAQSCRLPYDLIVDGVKKDLADKRYLVSPQDLCSIENVEQLKNIGIDSFKIEGRLKSAEYVASTVRAYKEKTLGEETLIDEDKLQTIYSRGFFNGWMDGVNHQELVGAEYSNHHGKEVGKIQSCASDWVSISSSCNLKPGDGLVFCDFRQEKEFGAKIYAIESLDKGNFKIFLANDFDFGKLKEGMRVFWNSSPKLSKEISATFLNKTYEKKIPIRAILNGGIGSPLALFFEDEDGNSAKAFSHQNLEASKNAPLSKSFLESEISALSGTCYKLEELKFELPSSCYIHQKELKAMRREASASLDKLRLFRESHIENSDFQLIDRFDSNGEKSPQISLLVRDISQVEAISGLPTSTVYLDFEFGKEYGAGLELIKKLGHRTGIATTRILKPGENGHLKQILRLNPDSILVRNLGALHYLKDSSSELIADFSMNITNSLSAKWLLSKGVSRFTPSYDLNQAQLVDLLSITGGSFAEITIHQYMPAFHMEHCVFAAFLSKGKSFKDCGRPCEKHRVDLRDNNGAIHPLKADAECRNTMFHGIPQSAARLLPELMDIGVRNFRIEALYETAAELKQKLEIYLKAIRREIGVENALEVLGISEKYGVSEGQLLSIGRYKDKKKGLESTSNI
jgi:putative protease